MAKPRRGMEWQAGHRRRGLPTDTATADEVGQDWEHYPADDAEENIGYQKLAWYAAPFGTLAVALLALAITVNAFKAIARGVIRVLIR